MWHFECIYSSFWRLYQDKIVWKTHLKCLFYFFKFILEFKNVASCLLYFKIQQVKIKCVKIVCNWFKSQLHKLDLYFNFIKKINILVGSNGISKYTYRKYSFLILNDLRLFVSSNGLSYPRGRQYRRLYQLSFFKISAKDTKRDFGHTNKCYTSIEAVKCLLVFVYTHTKNKTCFWKKKENKQGNVSVFSISANCF